VAEVEQTTALEHPRWRGYTPGMGVEAIAHRSSLSTGRGKKIGLVATFSDKARALVASGDPASRWRERELGSTFNGRKSGKRGALAPLTMDELTTAEAARKRRWRARTASVGFGHGRRHSRDERARGEATARLGQRAARSGWLSGRLGASGVARRGTGAWQPRGDGTLKGGSGAESGG
jgi:hypothetical protein